MLNFLSFLFLINDGWLGNPAAFALACSPPFFSKKNFGTENNLLKLLLKVWDRDLILIFSFMKKSENGYYVALLVDQSSGFMC